MRYNICYCGNSYPCTKCGCTTPTTSNETNRTFVVPVEAPDNYQRWLELNPDLDPNLNPSSPWTEQYWFDNYIQANLNYEQFEI